MTDAKIKTVHEYPPIPLRTFDWLAYREGDEEPGGLQGWGRTEAEAISELLDREAERDDEEAHAIVKAFVPLANLARKS